MILLRLLFHFLINYHLFFLIELACMGPFLFISRIVHLDCRGRAHHKPFTVHVFQQRNQTIIRKCTKHITIMSKSKKLDIRLAFLPQTRCPLISQVYQNLSLSCLACLKGLATSDAKELCKTHLFTSRYNSRCIINHRTKNSLYCYNRSRRREINLMRAGQQRLGRMIKNYYIL